MTNEWEFFDEHLLIAPKDTPPPTFKQMKHILWAAHQGAGYMRYVADPQYELKERLNARLRGERLPAPTNWRGLR